ncbi:MAG: hypothetical protein ACK5VH_06785, partial [bacterium]
MKQLSLSIITLAVVVGFTACQKNNLAVDTALVPASAAKFNTSVLQSTYYVRASGVPFSLPVGVTTVSDKARTINLTYASNTGAAAGVQYNGPATITIPAGKALDTLRVTGIFAGYPLASRVDTLRVTVGGGDVPKNDYNNTYTIIMRKLCDVNLTTLSGSYTKTREYQNTGTLAYGPYTTQVIGLASTGASSASGKIRNVYDWDWADLTVNLDWTNPLAPTATIPLQRTFGSDAYSVRSTPGRPNT